MEVSGQDKHLNSCKITAINVFCIRNNRTDLEDLKASLEIQRILVSVIIKEINFLMIKATLVKQLTTNSDSNKDYASMTCVFLKKITCKP